MMDKLISRQVAIDAVNQYISQFDAIDVDFLDGLEKSIDMVMKLPCALPEQKTGRWIWMGDKGDSRFMCSVCKSKENVPTCNGEPTIWEFCPNCGAKMEA